MLALEKPVWRELTGMTIPRVGATATSNVKADLCRASFSVSSPFKKEIKEALLAGCFLRRVCYLLVSYFVMNFLRRIFSVCHSFRSMCQCGRMKGFERCFKVEVKLLGADRISMLQFCDRLRRGYKLNFMSSIWRKKSPLWEILSPFWENKARWGIK